MSTHQQLLYHIVFSVKDRRPLLKDDDFRDSVWAYMTGICKNLQGFALKVGGYHDHAHLLVRIPAKIAVADFVGRVKANTSKHINELKKLKMEFHWQDGYGAFTVSTSQKAAVMAYIENQVEHHRKLSFQEEYLDFLARHEIEYDPKYLGNRFHPRSMRCSSNYMRFIRSFERKWLFLGRRPTHPQPVA